MNTYFKKQKGFTIMEVTVVIFVITIGLVSVLSLASDNIRIANLNKNELIASQLAQEGLELVRNIRDENWLDGESWKKDIIGDLTYVIDYTGSINDAADDINDSMANLKINASNFYARTGAINTAFNRLITVTNNQADYIELECEVQWNYKGSARSYVASTVLYNWR